MLNHIYMFSMLCWIVEFEQKVFAVATGVVVARVFTAIPSRGEEGCGLEPAHCQYCRYRREYHCMSILRDDSI